MCLLFLSLPHGLQQIRSCTFTAYIYNTTCHCIYYLLLLLRAVPPWAYLYLECLKDTVVVTLIFVLLCILGVCLYIVVKRVILYNFLFSFISTRLFIVCLAPAELSITNCLMSVNFHQKFPISIETLFFFLFQFSLKEFSGATQCCTYMEDKNIPHC